MKIEYDNEKEWLEERRKSIGASEVPTVLGLNPFDSPLQLYLRKRGEIPEKEMTEAMRLGHLLEPAIAEMYATETGRPVVDPGPYAVYRNENHPFLHATLDRMVLIVVPDTAKARGGTARGDLQIKNVGARMASHWEDQPPLYVQAQVQTELIAAEMSWGSIAALLAGQRFVWSDVRENKRFQEHLIVKVEAFWMRIEKGDPPPAASQDADVLKLLWPQHVEEKIVELPDKASLLDSEIAVLDDQIKVLDDQIKARKDRRDECANQLKQLIGDAERGVLPNEQGSWQWKTSPVAGYTVKPTTKRTLRRLKS
jgi:putative phage-type endonuclease